MAVGVINKEAGNEAVLMPNNNAKLRMDADYLQRLTVGIWTAKNMHRAIAFKQRSIHNSDLTRAVKVLQAIKDYAAHNGARIPSEEWQMITHDADGLRYVQNGKLAFKQLYFAVLDARRAPLNANYSNTLDLFNQFEKYLSGVSF